MSGTETLVPGPGEVPASPSTQQPPKSPTKRAERRWFQAGGRQRGRPYFVTIKFASFNHKIGKLAKHNFSGEQEN